MQKFSSDDFEEAYIENCELYAESLMIGTGARLSGVKLKGAIVIIGKSAKLENCVIESKGHVVIKQGAFIRDRAVLHADMGITVGSNSIIDRYVVIGGMQTEDSEFWMGDDCMISYHSYLNVTKGIRIGHGSGIGGFCDLFTHSAWQNIFDGYPVQYGPIVIGDHVYTGWNIFVMPNVNIGSRSTIGAGSLVTKSIPPKSLAYGSPAKVVKTNFPNPLTEAEQYNIAEGILHDFCKYKTEYEKCQAIYKSAYGGTLLKTKNDSILLIRDVRVLLEEMPGVLGVVIALKIPNEFKLKHKNWLQLVPAVKSARLSLLGNEFVRFLKRYGVRKMAVA